MGSHFTLTVDGLPRDVYVRQTGTSPKNAIIWIHGGTLSSHTTEPGEKFVETVPAEADHVDFGPRGLLNQDSDPRFVWVIPGLEGFPLYPAQAPSPQTDRNFIDELVTHIRANYPTVRAVMIASSSIGGILTWHLYASNRTHGRGVSGYFIAGAGEPTAGGYDWPAMPKDGRNCCLWNGEFDDHSQNEVGAKPWARSASDLWEAAGYTSGPNQAPAGLCGPHPVLRGVLEHLPVKYRRFVGTGLGHVWLSCIPVRAIVTFKQWQIWAT